MPKMVNLVGFWKTEANGRTVLPGRLPLIWHTLVENAKIDIFGNFLYLFCKKKGLFFGTCIFFSFLVFGPVEDEKEDHQCLGHWSECKFKLVPIVCNHSGGGGHRTKKENSVVSFCISVPASLPVYVLLHSIYC